MLLLRTDLNAIPIEEDIPNLEGFDENIQFNKIGNSVC
ncbi:MAG: hypothetical protein Ct9H300mP28_35390 [Pseudomonadota bacterium]|nr:MAG: hypothetical protein Ct9H300mP28_35390 [Pseudomonadota bacterium]